MKDIQEIKKKLIDAQKLCKRGIFDTYAVDKKAVKPLLELRAAIKEYLSQNENDIEALRAACYVECYLMNYKSGLAYLQKVAALSGERKDKQKLTALSELVDSFKTLSLSPDELVRLGDYLDEALESCDHSLKLTKIWLKENIDKKRHGRIIKGLQNSGGYCDCEVLSNVAG
jgi:hypothetical protein